MSHPLRVLILQNRAEDAARIRRQLRDGAFAVTAKRVTTETQFHTELQKRPPDLIFADYQLPAYDGLAALAAAQKQCPDTPFIFISDSVGEENVVEALHRGASDFVLKHSQPAALLSAVRRALQEKEEKRMRQEAERECREAEARYRGLFEQCPDGIVILDPATARPVEFNAAAHEHLGYTRDEFAKLSLTDINAVQSPEVIRNTIDAVLREGKRDFETLHRTRDGQLRHVHVTTQIINTSGRVVFHCLWRDITERKQAEQRIGELNLTLRASGAINALMVRERDPNRLLAEACNLLVETRGYRLAWIGQVQPESSRVIPVAHSGKDATVLREWSASQNDTPAWQAVLDAVIRTGLPLTCQDTAFDQELAPWKRDAAAKGFSSLAVVPMLHGSRTLGVVAVYSSRPGDFRHPELDLLKELASDLGLALQSIEHEKERNRVEESLRESERRYRLLFNSGYDAVFVHQRDAAGNGSGTFIEVNDIACHRLGYSREELLQKTPADISAPETLPDVPRIRATLATDNAAVSEGVHLTRDGRRIPVEISTHVFKLNGKSTRLSTVRDITERKRAETRLHLLSEALESAANAIVITDRDGKITWANAAFTRLSGYSLEEVLGRKPSIFKSGRHDQAFYQKLWQTVLAGQVWSSEMVNRRKDGTLYTEENTVTPVRNERGEVSHFIAVKQDVTARRRAEQELRESETRFRQMAETIESVFWLGNATLSRILYVSPAYERIWGRPRTNLYRRPESLIDAIHPGDRTAVLAAMQEKQASQPEDFTIEYRIVRPDGSQRWIRDRRFPIKNHAGEVERMAGMAEDITSQKRTELRTTAFSQLGQRLSGAKTAREAAAIIVDTADQLLGWDACLFDLYSEHNDTRSHLLSMDLINGERTECNPPYLDGPPTEHARRAIKEGGQLILRDNPLTMRPDGLPFGDKARPSASIATVPVRNGSSVVGILSIQSYKSKAYDHYSLETLQALADHCGAALERIRIQEAWRMTQERLQHLIAQSPAVIYSLKTDGKTMQHAWISDNVERLLGYTVAEAHGTEGLFDRLHPQDRQAVTDGLILLVTQKQIARDFRIRHKNGDYRWVHDEQRLLCDSNGTPVEIVGSWTDTTERKALEEQLRQAQKMEAVGQLAGGVAHDFNNMLAVIRGNAELLLMDEARLTGETREGLKHVVEASGRAANLTRQLLAFSRKQVLQPQSLVLNDVIANLTKMLKRIIGENIDLQCQIATPPPYVQADLGMMEQVILNLVVNARDAMPHGGQLLITTDRLRLDEAHIRANPQARTGDFVRMSVSDTGTGISPEVLPRIFEPFFTTKEIGKGTGLGLATVYGIIQQHQGWVEVSSQVGKGTTFKVFLPSIPAPLQAAATSAAGAELRGGTETVLLVEDDSSVRTTTRRVLENKGYTVLEATTAPKALALWAQHANEIDLLLTDIIMPEEITGRELAERLWRERPELKVVFISGYSADAVAKNTDFIRRTKSHFLQKPCSSRNLLETLRRCLDENESPVALEHSNPK